MLAEMLLSKWDAVRGGLIATIDRIEDGDLRYRPAANAYDTGELMLHIAHEERIELLWGLARQVNEMPIPYDAYAFADVGSIKGALSATHADSLRYLEGLSDDALMSEVELAWGGTARPFDMIWHVIEHEVHHRGELSLTLGLLGREGLDA